jgi:hypothetical protein
MWKAFFAVAISTASLCGALGPANAQSTISDLGIAPPPLSMPKALYYRDHPEEWKGVIDRLPKVRTLRLPQLQEQPAPARNSWTRTTNLPPSAGLSNPLLLTDGTVIVHVQCSATWYKLTPNAVGSYVNGTWSTIASLPSGYTPLYFASQILNDGRVVMNGGEYNNNGACNTVWQTKGAIYDPVSNVWTDLPPPAVPTLWTTIGDAQSIMLPNGRYMLADCCSTKQAILNEKTLVWTSTGTGKFDENDEEGWALLHDGTILTTNAFVNTGTCGAHAERYRPSTGAWEAVGDPTATLSDCSAPNLTYEVGPIVVRPNGTAVAFSGVTSGVAATSIFNPNTATWSAGPDLPTIATLNYNLADAPAVALPHGGILFAASPGKFLSPSHFFEFTSANSITQLPEPPNSSVNPAYVVNFLMLPTGQVLQTDFSNDVEIFTPAGTPNPAWKPAITFVATKLTRGQSYGLSGTQLTGITHGVYGDDQQAATNFPLVRLTNNTNHRVFFARTSGFSTRSNKPGQASTAHFLVPAVMTKGSYSLVVIANGISSDPVAVTVN